jgi:D-beta-D-heptose 7-phosphate kinase/D-beta-D-heptose 1-phosphate adenosyltransferase
LPDILVKGADYELDEIVGRDTVEAAGGKVVRVELYGDYSTEKMFRRIAGLYGDSGGSGT